MTALLTFEIFRGTAPESEADRLRSEIESALKIRNWQQEKVHTTFTKTWASVSDAQLKAEIFEVVSAARKVAAVSQPMRIEYVVLGGLGPAVASSF